MDSASQVHTGDQENNSNANTERPNRTRNQNSSRQQRHRARRGNNRNLSSREGFFMHYLFITLSVRYASFFKPTARRLIEFFTLIKAIFMLFLLIYIHLTFVKESGNCLEHVEKIWPRNGVLKVQAETNTSLPPYQFYFSKQTKNDWATSFRTSPYQAIFKYSLHLGEDGFPIYTSSKNESDLMQDNTSPNQIMERARKLFMVNRQKQCPVFNLSDFTKNHSRELFRKRFDEVAPKIEFLHMQKEDIQNWIIEDPSISDTVAEAKMLQMHEMSGFNIGPQAVRSYYAIEYSIEFGYLRLSAATRHKLGIPVLVVTLDPHNDSCFGEGVKRWMLDTFFGYDDLIMGSIKHLAEKDNKQGGGYLRNLVTGEHYKFITLWVSHVSYLLALAVMLVFTLVVTMLLRYSYHQIFVFMVELLHILDMDAIPVFPAAPMLTIILALVGTEEIMTEFFHDSTLAFYVILSIWIADQFDAICMHTIISRRHWVRFFFLYHFAFYAYHYRFNGQFSELALFTSWLFIQHSMFYFFHHYELPAIQRQIRLRQIILQNSRRNNNPPSPPNPESPPQVEPPVDDPAPDATEGSASPVLPTNEQPPSGQPPAATGTTVHINESENENSDSSLPLSRGNSVEQMVEHGGESIPREQCANNGRASCGPLFGGDDVLELRTVPDRSTKLISLESEPENFDPSLTEIANEEGSENKVEIWEEFKTVYENVEPDIEVEIGHGTFAGFKYCKVIFVLFFAVVSLLFLFAFAVIMLNQTAGASGRIGGRFGPREMDVPNLVR